MSALLVVQFAVLFVSGAALAAAAPAGELAQLRTLPLEPGWSADGVALADLDGDGAPEVLLAVHADGRGFARQIQTWKRGEQGAFERAEGLALTPDVVAFAHGDVLAGGGEELVLFNAGGVFALRPGQEARPVRLLATDLLWQVADPATVFEWRHGVRDVDRDGLADLVVPGPGGFTLALQRRTGDPGAPFGLVARVRVPPEASDPAARPWRRRERGERSFSLRLSVSDPADEGEDGGTFVSVSERVPPPFWLDWDADADLDLLVQTRTALHVWFQEGGGRFTEAPQLSLAVPVAAARERELDASYRAHVVDLDRDRRADYAVFAGDKDSDDVRTQGLFFAQAAAGEGPPLFGREGRPTSLLVFAGFLVDAGFHDLDADGYPELIVRSVRPDLIDQIRSAASESIDEELFVYRNRGGTLARKPDLARRFALAFEGGELELEFLGDLTEDGLSELLVRESSGKLRVLALRAPGGREGAWSLPEKPLWELSLAKDARVEVVRTAPDARAHLFLLESAQVHWVSFE